MAYTVASGDTLGKIAKANGLTLAQLLEMNPQYTDNPNLINIGDTIVTEAAKPATDRPATENKVADDTTGMVVEPPTSTTAKDTVYPDGAPGIMAGGTLTAIHQGDGTWTWAMAYQSGGSTHLYAFDSAEQVITILGKGAFAGRFNIQNINESALQDKNRNIFMIGSAAGLANPAISYTEYFDDVMREAGLEAGIRNPGKLGEYLADPDIQRIIAQGSEAAGNWSKERIQAEIRNTNYYRNVMYPGIDNILKSGIGGTNPEAVYMNYMDSVDSSLAALGYDRDADGSYRSKVGDMLNKGISADDFNTFAPTFIRAEQSQEYASVLNQWTERDLGKSLDFENWFDVLAGEASPDISQVVEKATLQFQADRTSTNLTADQISRLADLTQYSEAEMATAFSSAEEALLSVGQADLERYGLSQEALVNAAFGIETGTMSSVDVQRQARKAATELGIQDDQKAQFFVGFDRFSRPQRSGLAASAPEAG